MTIFHKNKLISNKLEAIRKIQRKYPTSHVGGSIGLMLHGIDLKRDLSTSDLDITIDEYSETDKIKDIDKKSDNNDFDFSFKITNSDNTYIKIDFRINPEPSFDIIEFNGFTYNVSKLKDILFWKQKYANKGSLKHANDLIVINKQLKNKITPCKK